jgi:hypothetical protein
LVLHTPIPAIPLKAFPLIHFERDYLTPNYINLTQSSIFSLNLTIYSSSDKELSIPLSFTLYIVRNGTDGEELNPEEIGFEYNLDPNLLILEPYGSNSSLIIVDLHEDAPVGEYQFYVHTGNSEETHVGGTSFFLHVIG